MFSILYTYITFKYFVRLEILEGRRKKGRKEGRKEGREGGREGGRDGQTEGGGGRRDREGRRVYQCTKTYSSLIKYRLTIVTN